jgi:hypothetical protein
MAQRMPLSMTASAIGPSWATVHVVSASVVTPARSSCEIITSALTRASSPDMAISAGMQMR